MTTLVATQAIDMTQLAQQFANFGAPGLVGVAEPAVTFSISI